MDRRACMDQTLDKQKSSPIYIKESYVMITHGINKNIYLFIVKFEKRGQEKIKNTSVGISNNIYSTLVALLISKSRCFLTYFTTWRK